MKQNIFILLILSALFSCTCKTEVHENDISETVEHLKTINYDEFRGSWLELRPGMFRSVIGEIDNVRIVVGLYGRNNEFRNDAKNYPLPDSLRNSENIFDEITKRRLPLNPRELSLVNDFIKTNLLELNVDTAGNVCGKVSPEIRFEIPKSPERIQELLQDGYMEYENKFYIKGNE